MERVIFACVHNAGRSQMAAKFFSELADPAKAEAFSAGTQPGERVHPEVVNVILARGASLLITMGCGDACPYVPGLHRDDWPLQDPKGLPLDEVRRIRNEIGERVAALVDTYGWRRVTSS